MAGDSGERRLGGGGRCAGGWEPQGKRLRGFHTQARPRASQRKQEFSCTLVAPETILLNFVSRQKNKKTNSFRTLSVSWLLNIHYYLISFFQRAQ